MAVIREPTLLLTPDSVGEWLGTKRVSKVAILMDPAIAGSPLVEAIRSAARSAGCSTTEQLLTAPGALSTLKALASRISTSDGIVAIGGGAVLDQAKLARALACSPTLEKWLDRTGRAGWVSLPNQLDPTLRLVAVATTVGTGAEVNSVACLDAPDGKRLVHGPALCPDAALLDPEATRTLPGQLVQEGVFEALSRAIGPYAGSHDELVFEDGIAESVAETLARLGHRVRDELLADGQVTATTRMGIARVSGFSHTHWLALGRNPYAYKAWFLATEISQLAGCRKTPALAGVLPVLWRQITSGNQALGSASRLQRIWERVAATAPGILPDDPAEGVARLAQRWGITPPVGFDVDAVVRSTLRRWGAGLPMLAGISSAQLREIVADCAAIASGQNADASSHELLVNAR